MEYLDSVMETHDILCHAPTDGLGKDEVDHKLVLGVESRPEPSWLQELFLLKSNLEVRHARSHRALELSATFWRRTLATA